MDDIKEKGQIAPRWTQRRKEGKENFCDGPRETCGMGLVRQGQTGKFELACCLEGL